MPQIPLYPGFQVAADRLPFSPLSTTDMPDIAGSQSRMMSEALFDMGNAAHKIALQVKQEINETITRKNDREFAEGIRGVLHDPEKGFMTLLGLEAMTGREQAISSLEKSYQTMEDHIADPDQRKMFSALAAQRLETARLQIDIHAAEQTQVFRESETSASVTSHAMDAALNLDQWHQPASPYAMNKEAMLKSFDDLVRMRGYGEEQTKLQKQALLSSFHGDIVNRLVEQENPQQARAYLESYTGEIQPKQAEGLNRLVDLANLKNDSSALSQSLIAADGKPQEALTALADHGKISPDLYKATRERIDYQETQRQAAIEAHKAKVRNEAREEIRKDPTVPLFDMPPYLLVKLEGKDDLEEIKAYRNALNNPKSVNTDWATYQSLNKMAVENREAFARINLEDHRTSMSQDEMENLAFMQEKAKDPKQSPGQAELMNQIGGMVRSLGFDQEGFEKERGLLTSLVIHAVREEEIQKGRPLDFEERKKVIQRTAISNHGKLTARLRDGDPDILKKKSELATLIIPHLYEYFKNGGDPNTTPQTFARGMAAALWNEFVDTGETLTKGAIYASPIGPFLRAIKIFSGENPLDGLTEYAEGKKMEITPEMRSGAASAEAILVFSPTAISKLKILSNAAKVNKAEKLIKDANVVEELKKVRHEKDIVSGHRPTEKPQADLTKSEPKPPGNSPEIPSSEHRTSMEKRADEIHGKEPGATVKDSGSSGAPSSEVKKPGTSNDPPPSDKSKTSHAQSNQNADSKAKSPEKPESGSKKDKITIERSEENFHLKVDGGKNGITASISKEDIIEFAIISNKTSSMRGHQMFAKMMEHYGNRTKGLLGSWTNKEIASNNKNLGKINELTAQGMPLEEAIHHAWTAEQLVPYNMTKAEIKLVEGIPGKYTKLYVLFTKP